jgi:hypothetical protein
MFRLSIRILPAFLLVAAAVRLAQGAENKAIPVRLLVPAYFYPAGDGLAAWKRMIESAEKTPIVAIVNPDSGPGKRADENYRAIFKLVQKSKITLIGYVTFSYAQRPLSAVKADVDSWLHFYPEVQGIFFDEQPSQAEQAKFANECFAYARKKIKNAVVVSNPGVACAREYLSGHDAPTACLFEHESGFDNFRLPDWAAEMSRDKFAVLLYGTKSADEMRTAFARALEKRAGFIYITDRPAPVPWGELPSYWDEEVAAAAQANKNGAAEKK